MKRSKTTYKGLAISILKSSFLVFLLTIAAFSGRAQQVVLCYPQSADYWTGTATASAKDQASLVKWTATNTAPALRGWFMFDISSIPTTATIDTVKLVFYCNTAYGTMATSITPLPTDPTSLSVSGSQIFTAITNATPYYTSPSVALTVDQGFWKTFLIGSPTANQARLDLSAAIASGKFAVGVKSPTTATNTSRWASGWAQTNYIPYLRVTYTAASPNDAGIDSITSPKNLYCSGTYPIKVKLRNSGIANLTSVKINWNINGGANTQYTWTGNLAPGATTYVTLHSGYVFNGGNYSITAATTLPNNSADGSINNDSKTILMQILFNPTLTVQPIDVQANANDTVVFTTVASPIGVLYQWQVSTDGCATFSSLTNNALYSNTTNQNLKISGVTAGMNGYMYRCLVNSTACPPALVSDTVQLAVGPKIQVNIPPAYACPGTTITIPVNVVNMANITAMKLTINYTSTVMNTPVIANLNAALPGANLTGSTPGHLVFNWSGPAASIASGKICDFQFAFVSGTTPLTFDLVTFGANKLAVSSGLHIPTNFVNGVAQNNAPVMAAGGGDPPYGFTTDVLGSAMFYASSTGNPAYVWQVSTNGGVSWTDLTPNATIYPNGINNDTLWIANAPQAYDNYKYRLKATACSNTVYSNPALLQVKLTVKMTLDTIYACHGDTITFNCRVRNLIDVGSISGSLYYKMAALQFINFPYSYPTVIFNNVNNVSAPGVPFPGYGAVLVGYYSLTPLNLANESIFFKARFKFLTDSTKLQWDAWNTGACEVSDVSGNVLSSVFQDGFALDAKPKITLQPSPTTIAAGDTATFTVHANGYMGVTYQWQVSIDGGTTWSIISASAIYSGVTSSVLKVRGPTQTPYNGYKYRCRVSGYCPAVFSNAALLTVTPPPVKFSIPIIYTCLGDTVVVSLNTLDFTSICGFNLKINYDNTTLTYQGFKEKHIAIGTGTLTVNGATPGFVTIGWTSPTAGNLASGTLLKLKFTTTTLLTNSPVTFTAQPTPVTYCPATTLVPKYTNGSITTSPLPAPRNLVTPPPAMGHFCVGGSGVQIGLDNSNLGINYGVYKNGVLLPAYSAVPGTGAPMFFEGLFNVPGLYTVIATDAISGCTRGMDGQVDVIADALPTAKTVTGGGSYCLGGTGVSVGVAASDATADYILYRNGTPVDTLPGNGGSLDFGVQTITGTYSVKARNAGTLTCLADMSNSVVITVNTPPTITNSVPNQAVCHNASTAAINFASDIGSSTYAWSYAPSSPSIGIISPNTGNVPVFTAQNLTTNPIIATFTVTPTANGCPGTPKLFTITVNPLPSVSLSAITPNPLCKDAAPITLTSSPAGGTYTGSTGINSPSNGMFNPFISTTGSQSVTYTYINATTTCQNSDTETFSTVGKPKISGTIKYDNLALDYWMGNMTIERRTYPGNVLVDNTTSAVSPGPGTFSFKCLSSGNYILKPTTTRPWAGGINAADALEVQKFTVGMITLTPLRKKAADVNNSTTLSTVDALLISRRFAGLITSFAAGDWVYGQTGGILTNDTVILQNSDCLKGLLALKTGDVNGSFTPGVASKTTPDISFRTEGEIQGEELRTFELPVYPEHTVQLGAMSVVLHYPDHYMEVMDIKSGLENFVYHIDRGEIRIAWFSVEPIAFNKDKPLFHIRGRILPGTPADAPLSFEAGIESELNDRTGTALPPSVLLMPMISYSGNANTFVVPDKNEFYLGSNFPNPFNQHTDLPYYLPETAQVRLSIMNLIGEEIAVVYEGIQPRGTHTLSLDAGDLAPGIYLYRMKASTESRSFDKSRNLVISK